jgi:hypothetical protein
MFTKRLYDGSHMCAESDTVAPGACWVAMYQHVVQQRPSCLTKAEFAPPSIDGTSRRIRHHG